MLECRCYIVPRNRYTFLQVSRLVTPFGSVIDSGCLFLRGGTFKIKFRNGKLKKIAARSFYIVTYPPRGGAISHSFNDSTA